MAWQIDKWGREIHGVRKFLVSLLLSALLTITVSAEASNGSEMSFEDKLVVLP